MPATNKSPRAAEGQDTDLVFRRLEGTNYTNQGKSEHGISTWESLGHSDPPGCLVGGQLVEKVAHLQENMYTIIHATDGAREDGENLGDCLEDELNIKVLEDVEEQLVGQAVQAEVRAVIHLHHRLG